MTNPETGDKKNRPRNVGKTESQKAEEDRQGRPISASGKKKQEV